MRQFKCTKNCRQVYSHPNLKSCTFSQEVPGFPAPALFLREDGKDEKEETVLGQPAGYHFVQVYRSPSCIFWASWYPLAVPEWFQKIALFLCLPEWRCVSWKSEKDRNRTRKEKKQGVIFPEFLLPQPESFSFTSLCSEWVQLAAPGVALTLVPGRRDAVQGGISTVGVSPAHF